MSGRRHCWRLNAFTCLLTIASIFPSFGAAKFVHVQFFDQHEILCEAGGEILTENDEDTVLRPWKAVLFSRQRKTSNTDGQEKGDVESIEGTSDSTEWAAVLDVVDNLGTVKQTSILEEVKNAFLLGASAVVLLAMNAEYIRKFQLDKALSKPVIAISANITRILKALTRSTTVFLVASWYDGVSKERSQYYSKVTLWSTCGRGRFPWEGPICMEPEKGKRYEENQALAVLSAGFLFVVVLLLVISCRNIGMDENEEDSNLTMMRCRQLAARRLKAMRCIKYKYRGQSSSRDASRSGSTNRGYSSGVEHRHSEICAICLDEYKPKQTVRVLPCSHQFHSLCVDGWLVEHQTCPLCVVNVFELAST